MNAYEVILEVCACLCFVLAMRTLLPLHADVVDASGLVLYNLPVRLRLVVAALALL